MWLAKSFSAVRPNGNGSSSDLSTRCRPATGTLRERIVSTIALWSSSSWSSNHSATVCGRRSSRASASVSSLNAISSMGARGRSLSIMGADSLPRSPVGALLWARMGALLSCMGALWAHSYAVGAPMGALQFRMGAYGRIAMGAFLSSHYAIAVLCCALRLCYCKRSIGRPLDRQVFRSDQPIRGRVCVVVAYAVQCPLSAPRRAFQGVPNLSHLW